MNFVRRGECSDILAHVLVQLLAQGVVSFLAGVQSHEGVDCLSFDLVRIGDDRGLRGLRMLDKRAFHLRRTNSVPETLITSSTRPVIQ